MTQANERRAQSQGRDTVERRAQGERQEKESERRHAEVMAALDTPRRALEVLIERTAPKLAS